MSEAWPGSISMTRGHWSLPSPMGSRTLFLRLEPQRHAQNWTLLHHLVLSAVWLNLTPRCSFNKSATSRNNKWLNCVPTLVQHIKFVFALISRPKAAMCLDRNLSHDKDENHYSNSMFKSCSADLSKATLGEKERRMLWKYFSDISPRLRTNPLFDLRNIILCSGTLGGRFVWGESL